jgi:hypothetical protein
MLLWRESRALGGVLVGAELIFEGGEGSVSMCCLLGKKTAPNDPPSGTITPPHLFHSRAYTVYQAWKEPLG